MTYDVGRELDLLIATKLLKVMVLTENDVYKIYDLKHKKKADLPYYSSKSEDNYYLIAYLQSLGITIEIGSPIVNGNIQWVIKFRRDNQLITKKTSLFSMQHAICLCCIDLAEKIESNEESSL